MSGTRSGWGSTTSVLVNLSATSLDDPTLPHLIEQLLEETGADPETVLFEITETALSNSNVNAGRFAVRVHELGCRLARDFGLKTVGEGVEDQATLDVLKDHGVDYA